MLTSKLVEVFDQKFKSKNNVPVTSIRLSLEDWNHLKSHLTAPKFSVDWLAQVIREVDGNHQLGAGALAEKLHEALEKLVSSQKY